MLKEIISVTLILFSIIDVLGNIPIFISLKEKNIDVNPLKASVASGVIMIAFLFVGELILSLFGVDVGSFALAGAIVIFIIGLEMVLGVEFFKHESLDTNSGSIFPVAFPLVAGAGTLTTILSLKAEYQEISIIAGILINLIILFIVIYFSDWLQKNLGGQGTSILRKVFGIILLAISIKLFKGNI
ncbi:MAG: multiple antibiotic resistance protein [Cognaticolwellia sp.]|jgi:multiple antibiotic resistance protein